MYVRHRIKPFSNIGGGVKAVIGLHNLVAHCIADHVQPVVAQLAWPGESNGSIFIVAGRRSRLLVVEVMLGGESRLPDVLVPTSSQPQVLE